MEPGRYRPHELEPELGGWVRLGTAPNLFTTKDLQCGELLIIVKRHVEGVNGSDPIYCGL